MQAIRFVAHLNGASLVCSSNSEKAARDLVSRNYGADTGHPFATRSLLTQPCALLRYPGACTTRCDELYDTTAASVPNGHRKARGSAMGCVNECTSGPTALFVGTCTNSVKYAVGQAGRDSFEKILQHSLPGVDAAELQHRPGSAGRLVAALARAVNEVYGLRDDHESKGRKGTTHGYCTTTEFCGMTANVTDRLGSRLWCFVCSRRRRVGEPRRQRGAAAICRPDHRRGPCSESVRAARCWCLTPPSYLPLLSIICYRLELAQFKELQARYRRQKLLSKAT